MADLPDHSCWEEVDHEEDRGEVHEAGREDLVPSCEVQGDREALGVPSYRVEDQTLWQEYSGVHAFVRDILGSKAINV